MFGVRGRRRRLRRLTGGGSERVDRPRLADRRPRTAAAAVGLLGALAATVVGGPVAGAAAGIYGAFGALALLRRRRHRRASEAGARALDAVAVLAADLRAGVPPGRALGAALPALAPSGVPAVGRLAERIAAAWEVAEEAGSPLADLLDRLEADVRGLDRIRREAAAQAAGAGATSWLLAALPAAGIGVGYGMGADPLRILLRTPVGAVCAGLALLLQVAGTAWSGRLVRAIGEAT